MTPQRISRQAIALSFIGVVIASSIGAVTAAPLAAAAPRPIIIALEAPLTGEQSANGLDMYRGARLAVDQVNARGGVLGRPVRLIKANDQANPDLALTVAKRVNKAGAVAVIGPYNSSVGVINLPYYLAHNITPVQLTSIDSTTGEGVTVQPKNSQISPVEIAYLSTSSGCPKVVMLVDPSTYTQGMADRVGAAMICGDGAPVQSIPITEGLADYSAQVAQALALKPDFLYVSTYFPEGSKIAVAINAAGSKASCLMGLANVDPAFVTAAGLVASQRCAFSGVPAAAQMPDAAAYVKAYRATFKIQPAVWGTFTYDSANILFAAMEKAGSTQSNAVLARLLKTKTYPGQTGAITINAKTGNRTKVPVYILTVDKTGTFVIG
jgi:branched-chain amino acid transport system substrate-binding protein